MTRKNQIIPSSLIPFGHPVAGGGWGINMSYLPIPFPLSFISCHLSLSPLLHGHDVGEA